MTRVHGWLGQRQSWRLALLTFSIFVVVPGIGLAQRSSRLADAEAAYAQIDFENTLRLTQNAIEHGDLSTRELARAYELIRHLLRGNWRSGTFTTSFYEDARTRPRVSTRPDAVT